jgi:hypothetical protein
MGKYDYDDDDDELFGGGNDPQADTPLVRQLRKQIKKLEADKAAAEERASKTEKVVRQRTVADVLKEKGVNPALSRFVLQDLDDPTPEAVSSWLSENGELFGIKPNVSTDPAQALGLPTGTELPSDLIQAYQKFVSGQASGGSNPDPSNALAAKLADPNLSQEELLGLIASAN